MATTELSFELESDLRDIVERSRKWLVDFNAGKAQLVSFDWSNNTGAIDGKKDGSFLEEKSSFKIMRLSFSSNCIGALTLSLLLKLTASKEIGALIRFAKFLSPEVVLYLYKSTRQLCHVWEI